MLETLKESIRNESPAKTDYEIATEEMDMEDIKDAFLDDPETMVMGAEDDPEIAKIVETIPEDKDADEPTEKDINELVENFIPESIIH